MLDLMNQPMSIDATDAFVQSLAHSTVQKTIRKYNMEYTPSVVLI